MPKLTKKEIGTVNVGVLNTRYCELIQKGETMPAGLITYGDMKEFLWIEDELRVRLIKFIGHDFYPPDRIEKAHPSNYMISLLKKKKVESEVPLGPMLSFTITITSSLGSMAAKKDVKVGSRSEADLEAQKMIERLGLKKATFKIS